MSEKDTNGEKKEKVLHTRVSPSLDEELRERANQLGVSVSNLVRNVLLNAFEMVEDIVVDSGRMAKAAKGQAGAAARNAVADLASVGKIARPVGWQEMILNVNAVCADCNAIIAKGTGGARAVFSRGGPETFICKTCLASLGDKRDEGDKKEGDDA